MNCAAKCWEDSDGSWRGKQGVGMIKTHYIHVLNFQIRKMFKDLHLMLDLELESSACISDTTCPWKQF